MQWSEVASSSAFLTRSFGGADRIKKNSFFKASTNEQCERLNRYVMACVRIPSEQRRHAAWCQFSPRIALSYRIAVMGAIDALPTPLMFLHVCNCPPTFCGNPGRRPRMTKNEYPLDQTARMRDAYDLALAVQEKPEKEKTDFVNLKVLKKQECSVGDLCWLFMPTIQDGMAKVSLRKTVGHKRL